MIEQLELEMERNYEKEHQANSEVGFATDMLSGSQGFPYFRPDYGYNSCHSWSLYLGCSIWRFNRISLVLEREGSPVTPQKAAGLLSGGLLLVAIFLTLLTLHQ